MQLATAHVLASQPHGAVLRQSNDRRLAVHFASGGAPRLIRGTRCWARKRPAGSGAAKAGTARCQGLALHSKSADGSGPGQPAGEDMEAMLRFFRQLSAAEQRAALGSGASWSRGVESAGAEAGVGAEVAAEAAWKEVAVERAPFTQESGSPEPLTPAEPLESPAVAASKAARSAAKLANAAAAAAQDAAEAVAAAQGEVLFTAEQLVQGAASDAADVLGAAQQAATDVQQQAASVAGDVISDAADMAAAAQQAAKDVQQQAAKAVASASEPPPAATSTPPPPPAASAASRSSSATAAATGQPPAADNAAEIERVKETLIRMLASLDRGAAATEDQAERVDNLARQLEALAGPVQLSWDKPASGAKPTMAIFDGRWRLLYSSGFTSGSLGGRRPGPAFGGTPLTLGQVHQDVFTDKSELDNVVELFLRYSLAALPGLGAATPTAVARLRHTFEIVGSNTVEITFTDTEVKLAGGLQGWLDNLPTFSVPQLPDWLQPPKRLRSARFDVVFMDEQMRITRGDRGELRVFLKGAT